MKLDNSARLIATRLIAMTGWACSHDCQAAAISYFKEWFGDDWENLFSLAVDAADFDNPGRHDAAIDLFLEVPLEPYQSNPFWLDFIVKEEPDAEWLTEQWKTNYSRLIQDSEVWQVSEKVKL